jgi:hypothetical protein
MCLRLATVRTLAHCSIQLPQNLLNEPRCKGCPAGTIAAWYDEMARFTKSVSDCLATCATGLLASLPLTSPIPLIWHLTLLASPPFPRPPSLTIISAAIALLLLPFLLQPCLPPSPLLPSSCPAAGPQPPGHHRRGRLLRLLRQPSQPGATLVRLPACLLLPSPAPRTPVAVRLHLRNRLAA